MQGSRVSCHGSVVRAFLLAHHSGPVPQRMAARDQEARANGELVIEKLSSTAISVIASAIVVMAGVRPPA
jgi:hypothetical protein